MKSSSLEATSETATSFRDTAILGGNTRCRYSCEMAPWEPENKGGDTYYTFYSYGHNLGTVRLALHSPRIFHQFFFLKSLSDVLLYCDHQY